MNILGISAYFHDSAAAILRDGQLIAAAQEERFTRIKHDAAFPAQAVRYCLQEAGLRIDQLDAVAFYDKPLLKFERLLETYYAFAPRGWRSFLTGMPVWLQEKMFLKRALRQELANIMPFDRRKLKLLFPEHHLSHAASAFYPSPFEEAAILTIDGVGEWATASICHGKGKSITILKELHFPHSLGLLYSAFTYFLGFTVNSGEYKLMGLAPYGNPQAPETAQYLETIRTELVDLRPDGSLWLNQRYFDYATGLRMARDADWERLFGFAKRQPDDPLEAWHCNLGLAIQQFTEDVVLRMARETQRLSGARYLCMAGGVALNCVANGKLQRAGLFDEIFIQPAAGDAGGAPGAAYAAQHIYFQQERPAPQQPDALSGSYLGPDFSDQDVRQTARKYQAPCQFFEHFEDLARHTAGLLNAGQVVGWVQGRMEFGPRALGNRSILGDPRNPEMQQKLNLKIKYRESFRPFAPSVQAERVAEYFDYSGISPYMLLVHPVHPARCKPLPPGYAQLPIREKLYFLRSDMPSITHIDFSARIQTVHRETNPRYWALLEQFRQLSGMAVLVNTSFNVRGEPIVCTPEDAYRCFMRTDMDVLVLGNFLFQKSEQPTWLEKDGWKEEFVLD
ncbi:MAG: carbamoyltransferase [Saprospiraceae bacterium]|nr:carbamoyltransferase [Saprospiraceae bacterium]